MQLVATVPLRMEDVLAEELRQLGVGELRVLAGAVSFEGELELAYRLCLWSRLANRVLVPLLDWEAGDGDAVYEGARQIDWTEHLGSDDTFAIDVAGAATTTVSNTHFAALRIKDAIVDQLRERTGRRPSVDTEQPSVRLHAYLRGDRVQLRLDLSGGGLHRRGYRDPRAPAPLKENFAAGLLYLAQWPALAAAGGSLIDPMCGSGTLPIEAGLIATDTAPGLLRASDRLGGWRGHRTEVWRALWNEARERDRRSRRGVAPATVSQTGAIIGCDHDARAVAMARKAVARAGLAGVVRIERRDVEQIEREPALVDASSGMLVVNPPYGHRLGEKAALEGLYLALGRGLKASYRGWTLWLLSGDAELARCLGLRSDKRRAVVNGGLACRWLRYPIGDSSTAVKRSRAQGESSSSAARPGGEAPAVMRLARSPQAEAFADRLRKNARHWGRWARRNDVSCYRVYDADIPEYAAAVDIYEDRVLIQEYAPPNEIDPARSDARLHDMVLLSPAVLGVSAQNVYLKVRRRQRGTDQYDKQQVRRELIIAREGGHRFSVNLTEYLDTGLFLDQRQVRALLAELAAGRRFLNLFCYTGSATVYAALGGAPRSVSVDLSPTYLQWAERNLDLNGIDARRHRFERADCMRWIHETRERFGLIYLDTPTFSRSKRMSGTLDIQRDHPALLRATLRLLEPGGVLIFTTHHQRFRLDPELQRDLAGTDLSAATLPPDFARRPRIRQVWRFDRAAP